MANRSILNDEPTDPPAHVLDIDPDAIARGLKAGWKTTEFWATIGVLLLAVGVSIGLLTNDQAESVTKAVGSLIALLAAAWPVSVYSKLRTSLKKDL